MPFAFLFQNPRVGKEYFHCDNEGQRVAGGGSSPRYSLRPAFHVCSYAGMYPKRVACAMRGSVTLATRVLLDQAVTDGVRASRLALRRARSASSSAASFRPITK